MTDPIASVVSLQAYQPQRADVPVPTPAAFAPAETDGASPEAAAPAAPTRADPIALSVDRDATGVFVYTLTDSASGRVLAVIPRSAVVGSAHQADKGVNIQA